MTERKRWPLRLQSPLALVLIFSAVFGGWCFWSIICPVPLTLEIDCDVYPSGVSELYSETHAKPFNSEDKSAAPVAQGHNTLRFFFDTHAERLRWDPLMGPGEFTLRSIRIRSGLFGQYLSVGEATPLFDIARDTNINLLRHFASNINAIDPQILLPLPVTKFIRWSNIIAKSALAGAVAILSMLALVYDHQLRQYVAYAARYLTDAGMTWAAFGKLLSICICCQLFRLTNFTVGIDDELSALRATPDIWLSEGRWAIYWIEKILAENPVVPFLPHLVFCGSISFFYLAIHVVHRASISKKSFFLFPLFSAFPTWNYITRFHANTIPISIGLIAVACFSLLLSSSYQQDESNGSPYRFRKYFINVSRTSVAAALTAIAVGCYQTFLLLQVCIILGLTCTSRINRVRSGASYGLRWLYRGAVWSCGGMLLYAVVLRLHTSSNAAHSDFFVPFLRGARTGTNYYDLLMVSVVSAMSVLRGSSSAFGTSLSALLPLLILGVLGFFYKTIKAFRSAWESALVIAVGASVIVVPFALYPLSGGWAPSRTLVAVPYLVWGLAMFAFSIRRVLLQGAAVLLVGCTTWQTLYCNCAIAASAELALRSDSYIARAIESAVEVGANGLPSQQNCFIDFFGQTSERAVVYPRAPASTAGASFFQWDEGNPKRIYRFMTLAGYNRCKLLPAHRRVNYSDEYKRMTSWPKPGSVNWVGAVVLVKLGEVAGPTYLSGVEWND